ncbi:MAG: hypothetical protein WBF90_32230 [Rivularia sp. (in: cyanobacteria)]
MTKNISNLALTGSNVLYSKVDKSSSQKTDELIAVSESLVIQAKNANTPNELEEILNVSATLTNEYDKKRQQEIIYLQEIDKLNSIKSERRLKAVKEIFRIFSCIGSVILGLYVINITPLLTPLLIILGISGALQYELKDVAEIASKINKNQDFDINEE